MLVGVAERLYTLLGQNALIFRESEDELFVFIDDTSVSRSKQTGRDIVEVIAEPFKIDQLTFYVTASVGISYYPQTGKTIETLLQQAEIAMFKVKKTGKNNFHIFLPEDAVYTERKRRIEFGLKEALVNNELYLVYQPKVVLETGKILDAEALLRWRHPNLGLVSPGEFIPIAEESGLINEIGYWVIYEAVRQTKEWHKQGIEISIAVNVSALQFEDRYLVRRIKNVLDLFELDAKYFIVEITESVMQNLDYAEAVIRELHVNNIRVAIDDFGTGYSSLSVLHNMYIYHRLEYKTLRRKKLRNKIKQMMQKEEGFTLVELLAVIVILGIIVAIAIPAIGNVISNATEDAGTAEDQMILDAARLYDMNEDLTWAEGGTITVGDLVTEGYLEPRDSDNINEDNDTDKIWRDGNGYSLTDPTADPVEPDPNA